MDSSDAAILLASEQLRDIESDLERVMTRKRYSARTAAVPASHLLALDEQLHFEIGQQDTIMIVRTPVDAVYRVARWWSREVPETPLAAVRRYAHSQPCLKFFLGGLPIWRLGEDPDHEVDFDVPTRRPLDAFDPIDVGLPHEAVVANDLLRTTTMRHPSYWLRSNSRFI